MPKMVLSGRQAEEAALLKMKGTSTLARAMSWMNESGLYCKLRMRLSPNKMLASSDYRSKRSANSYLPGAQEIKIRVIDLLTLRVGKLVILPKYLEVRKGYTFEHFYFLPHLTKVILLELFSLSQYILFNACSCLRGPNVA